MLPAPRGLQLNGRVVTLSTGQRKAQGMTPASTLTCDLVLKPPRLRPGACVSCPPLLFKAPAGARMRTDEGAADEQVLHVWVIREMLMHLFPNFVVAPAREPFADAVPVAIRIRPQPPLGTAPGDPEHAFEKTATRNVNRT